MKSYKEAVKSYRDLPKDIILNAPEGAMWVGTCNRGEFYYYTCNLGNVYLILEQDSQRSMVYPHLVDIQESDAIPLPNIEIPWEATEDSKCPVPDGTEVQVFFYDGEDYTDEDPEDWNWRSRSGRPITSYKIIDEEYLEVSAQDDPIEVDELEMHRAAYQAIKNAGFESPEELLAEHLAFLDTQGSHIDYEVLTSEDSLIKRLEFLQNLANKFPEIKDEAIKFMSCELDGYMNTLWENEESE